MPLHQLIYSSRPFGYDDSTLDAILFSARHHNKLNDVTGALICREDIFLQLLEGPKPAVEATFARIAKDVRHISPVVLVSGEVSARQFPNWDMRHDPAHSWLWTPDDVWAGAPQKASPAVILGIFARVAAEQDEGEEALV